MANRQAELASRQAELANRQGERKPEPTGKAAQEREDARLTAAQSGSAIAAADGKLAAGKERTGEPQAVWAADGCWAFHPAH